MSKKRNYLDLKRRITDCLNALHGRSEDNLIKETDLRLWKFAGRKEELLETCTKISNKDDRIEVDD